VLVITDANFAAEFKKGPMLLEIYAPVRMRSCACVCVCVCVCVCACVCVCVFEGWQC
jgi:hypothetical protein